MKAITLIFDLELGHSATIFPEKNLAAIGMSKNITPLNEGKEFMNTVEYSELVCEHEAYDGLLSACQTGDYSQCESVERWQCNDEDYKMFSDETDIFISIR